MQDIFDLLVSAGSSPLTRGKLPDRFPRVSGDEPGQYREYSDWSPFSPRERG